MNTEKELTERSLLAILTLLERVENMLEKAIGKCYTEDLKPVMRGIKEELSIKGKTEIIHEDKEEVLWVNYKNLNRI